MESGPVVSKNPDDNQAKQRELFAQLSACVTPPTCPPSFPLTQEQLFQFVYHNNERANLMERMAQEMRKNLRRKSEEHGNIDKNDKVVSTSCKTNQSSPVGFNEQTKEAVLNFLRNPKPGPFNKNIMPRTSVNLLPSQNRKGESALGTHSGEPDSPPLSKSDEITSNMTLSIEDAESVKLPQSPTKSDNFLTSISCVDTGRKYIPDSSSCREFTHEGLTAESGDLPFSILTIREQREYLKKNEEAFVQDAPCYEISKMYGVETSGPNYGQDSWCKCRECRSAKQKDSMTVFCRFYGFRKLKFSNNLLCTSGFLLPEDCEEKDLQLWLPQKQCFWEEKRDAEDLLSPNDPLDDSMNKFILSHIAKRFCSIVLHEKRALAWIAKDETMFWKRPVAGVRELCDVCETTLFNIHWVCWKCGFGVCLDCYERRMDKTTAEQEIYDNDKLNCFRWLRCTKGKNHFHSSLLPTQIIPSTCLWDLSEKVHEICSKWNIKSACACQKKTFTSTEILLKLQKMQQQEQQQQPTSTEPTSTTTKNDDDNEEEDSQSRKRKSSTSDWLSSIDTHEQKSKDRKLNKTRTFSSGNKGICVKEMIAKRIQNMMDNQQKGSTAKDSTVYMNSFIQRNWLCGGKLLQLMDSQHPKNIDIFKLHWRYGMPVLVSGVGRYLNMELWHPSRLSREYGEENSKNSLVNCMTGSIITNMKIRDFWDGFENISQRLLDEDKKRMILKLKDWPPTEAFRDVMPEMFQDLMRALPLPEYTFIGGKCNLASRLPHFFVKPDLGPKMYNAYGWVTESDWRRGTTNLHLDVSDAVNIMVYVGIPDDEPAEAKETLLQIVREGEVDEMQFNRAITDKPGALWHIFHERDCDKIRQFIKKVCHERGETVAEDHDPIHDQQMYLDKQLRHRLRDEYNVEGYSILQCQGDGVFIPAGAPHQVFNLHSCIKIAEDFVSPEHVDKCFQLTKEFRYLSSTHSNHEDKLQIKNIIYHCVKDIVSSAIHINCV